MEPLSPRKRVPPPIDSARLEELALAYVARFATSAAKLEGYLRRKLRERGWAGAGEGKDEDGGAADRTVAGIVARFVAAGYIDDQAFARAKTGSLLRRGYGQRRIARDLDAAGIGADDRAAVRSGMRAQRQAALLMARKRGFGPFGRATNAKAASEDGSGGPALPDRARREKQLAAMLRAGHSLDSARELVDAPSVQAAEQWALEAMEDNPCD